MSKKRLKGNEKLRAVYNNAASALTVQFNDPRTKQDKPWGCPNIQPDRNLNTTQVDSKKPP